MKNRPPVVHHLLRNCLLFWHCTYMYPDFVLLMSSQAILSLLWSRNSLTKQSLQSDTFLYVRGTIIANVYFLHGRKMVILFIIHLNYRESVGAPVVLAMHVHVSDCKLCFVDNMNSQVILSLKNDWWRQLYNFHGTQDTELILLPMAFWSTSIV